MGIDKRQKGIRDKGERERRRERHTQNGRER